MKKEDLKKEVGRLADRKKQIESAAGEELLVQKARANLLSKYKRYKHARQFWKKEGKPIHEEKENVKMQKKRWERATRGYLKDAKDYKKTQGELLADEEKRTKKEKDASKKKKKYVELRDAEKIFKRWKFGFMKTMHRFGAHLPKREAPKKIKNDLKPSEVEVKSSRVLVFFTEHRYDLSLLILLFCFLLLLIFVLSRRKSSDVHTRLLPV